MPNNGWRKQSKCIFDSERRFEIRRIRNIRVRDSESRLYFTLGTDIYARWLGRASSRWRKNVWSLVWDIHFLHEYSWWSPIILSARSNNVFWLHLLNMTREMLATVVIECTVKNDTTRFSREVGRRRICKKLKRGKYHTWWMKLFK